MANNNREYPNLPLKTTNELFIKGGQVFTREWYTGPGDVQCMRVVDTDPKTAREFKAEQARIKKTFDPKIEPPSVPHGGSNINNRTEDSAFSGKRGW